MLQIRIIDDKNNRLAYEYLTEEQLKEIEKIININWQRLSKED